MNRLECSGFFIFVDSKQHEPFLYHFVSELLALRDKTLHFLYLPQGNLDYSLPIDVSSVLEPILNLVEVVLSFEG